MKEKIYKLFLTIMVCLSLGSAPAAAQNEIAKMLEALSGTAQVRELDEEEERDNEEITGR